MIHDIKDKVNMYMMSIHLHGYFSSILTTIRNHIYDKESANGYDSF